MAEKGKDNRQRDKQNRQKKNGMSGKMKRNIRYSLAGIFLVSAVAIAAIPSDRSGKASATVAAGDQNPVMDYTTDSAATRNGDLQSSALDMNATEVKTFSISYEGAIWELTQQFKAKEKLNQTSDCIIYQYDVDNVTQNLVVPRQLPTDYKMVKEASFTAYNTNTIQNLTFTVKPSQTSASVSMNNLPYGSGTILVEDLKKYYPNVSAPAAESPDLVIYGSDMEDSLRYRFYCDYEGSDASLKGKTLERVLNRAIGKLDDPNFTNDEYILVARNVDSTGEMGPQNDANGFVISGFKTVVGIAGDAFKNSSFLKSVTLPDSVTAIGDEAFKGCGVLEEVKMDSVTYIGNRVFQGCTYLKKTGIPEYVNKIGKEAYEGCVALTGVEFPQNTTVIGFGAFANCTSLSTINLGNTLGEMNIGEYAFYNTPNLKNVSFNDNGRYGLGKACFALKEPSSDMGALGTFNFPRQLNNYKSENDTADAAYNAGGGYTIYKSGAAGTAYNSKMGDYILAGRSGLQKVYMPASMGTTSEEQIPLNTFADCWGLGAMELGSNNNRYLTFDKELFRDVENSNLYVFGPEKTNENTTAKPRECTWAASTKAEKYVPYKYAVNTPTGADIHYEVGIAEEVDPATGSVTKGYRFDLELLNDKDAAIRSCDLIGNVPVVGDTEGDNVTGEDKVFSIPSQVATYNVTALNDGSLDPIKDKIQHLVVPDGSLTEIKDSVFHKADNLESVEIGSSVKTIGKSAFANCAKLEKVTIGPNVSSIGEKAFASNPKLEHVYWNGNAGSQGEMIIGNDAFATGGNRLYFYGEATEGFSPFDYAMGNVRLYDNASERICYIYPSPLFYGEAFARGTWNDAGETAVFVNASRIKDLEDYPHYKIIADDGTNLATLIDYPQFRDLPADIQNYWLGAAGAPASLSPNDLALIDGTININVPEAVRSIDVKAYINNKANAGNLHYFSDAGIDGTTNKEVDVYGGDGDDDLHPGLFSGYTIEDDKLKSAKNELGGTEEVTKGNDWVRSISLPGVKTIPDYAFDSCERLESLIISKDTTDIGTSAFQGCTNLQTIGTNGNPKYVCENCILYEVNDKGVELNTCLPYRGNTGTQSVINVTTDPMIAKLTSVKEGAFAGCKNITDVDLRSDQTVNAYNGVIDAIPSNCFNGCKKLSQVTLPESVRFVGGKAFHDNNDPVRVILPEFASIESDAFDDGKARIYSYYEDKEKGTIKNQAYGNSHNIEVYPLEGVVRVTLRLDDDYTVFRTITVGSPTDAISLPGAADMATVDSMEYPGQGYVFKCWRYVASDGKKYSSDTDYKYMTENIIDDRTYKAVYERASQFTVTYYDADGDVYDSFTLDPGKTIGNRKPAPPVGYMWVYTYPVGFDESQPVNSNVTAMAYPDPDYVDDSSTPTPTPDPDVTIVPTLEPETTATPTPEPTRDPNSTPTPTPGAGQTPTPTPIGYVATPTPIAPVTGGYQVTVENGAGSGYFRAGSVVTITAYSPAAGQQFDRWTTSNTDIGFSNVNAVSTTFIMPSHDVKVTATYKKQSTSGNATPGSGQYTYNTTGNGTKKSQDKGSTDVVITTDTIDNNNKNRGTATVAGSTDNFVLKITDSAAATAAVDQALRNMYGERFANINYAAFDISLYDSTGTNLISNANDLAVTVTMPIPDALTKYAGNNRAGAVVNGQLQELSVKFVSLDGVPCMRFTATHFSPYTIFVDTQNVVRGISDTTPKTGDGIAPKWFLSAGMLSLSAILFLWRDKKPELAEALNRKKKNRK